MECEYLASVLLLDVSTAFKDGLIIDKQDERSVSMLSQII